MAVDDTVRASAKERPSPEGVQDLLAGVLGEHGRTDRLQRLTAFEHGAGAATGSHAPTLDDLPPAVAALLDKVARNAYDMTDGDIARAREAGLSEHDLFELIVATAAGAGLSRRALGRAAVARWERGR